MKRFMLIIIALVCVSTLINCTTDKKPASESKKPSTAKTIQETKNIGQIKEPETTTDPETTTEPETATEVETPVVIMDEPEITGSVDDIVAWRYKTGDIKTTLVTDGKVYVVRSEYNATDGKLVCLDEKSGKKYWESNCIHYGLDSYKLFSGVGFVAVQDKLSIDSKSDIDCFDVKTGEKLCRISNSPYIASDLATLGDSIFFITDDGIMHCYNVRTGKKTWELKRFDKNNIIFCATEDKVFCSIGKTLKCLNAQDGKKLWQFEASNNASLPTVSNGKVYLGTQSCFKKVDEPASKNYFYCLDLQTGTQDWSMELESSVSNLPVIIGNYACFMDCTNENTYIGLDLTTQKILWQNEASDVKIVYDALYLMMDGKWSKVDIATGQATEAIDLGTQYEFTNKMSDSYTIDYVQYNVSGLLITDNMFEPPLGTRLQRVYRNENVYVSNYPNIAAGKVYGCTIQKKLWETPNDWTVVPSSFPGQTYSYFWVFNDKVLVLRKNNNTYSYVCLDKMTGKKLWEMPKGNFRIDGFENGTLTLHSITSTKEIDTNDGSVRNERLNSFDKQIIFETKLSGNQVADSGINVYDLSEGFFLYVTFYESRNLGEIERNRFLVDKNGKFTPLFIKKEGLDFENIRRCKSKFYVTTKKTTDYDKIIQVTEIDSDTGKSKSIKEADVPTNAVLLQKVQDTEPVSNALESITIKKTGIIPHKSSEYYSCQIMGINYGKFIVCQREIYEGMEYVTPYSDYTGVYDVKTLKKLWSYDKRVQNVYLHQSTIIITGDWENQVVLFCDIATGKTLLEYVNARFISKVGDFCFVKSDNKLIGVNLKKLAK